MTSDPTKPSPAGAVDYDPADEKIGWERHAGEKYSPAAGNPNFGVIEKADARALRFSKRAGKTVMADGLVSRRGYRRILPVSDDSSWIDDHSIEEVIEAAREALYGPHATVFERLVLDPLQGTPAQSVEEIARQFGRNRHYVDKIKSKALKKVKEYIAASAFKAPPPYAREICEVCNRDYPINAYPRIRRVCKGFFGNTGGAPASKNPKCLYVLRVAHWEKRRASITPAVRADMEQRLREKRAQEEAAFAAWRARDNARFRREMDEVSAIMAQANRSYKLNSAWDKACQADTDEALGAALDELKALASKESAAAQAFKLAEEAVWNAETSSQLADALSSLLEAAAGNPKDALERLVFRPAK